MRREVLFVFARPAERRHVSKPTQRSLYVAASGKGFWLFLLPFPCPQATHLSSFDQVQSIQTLLSSCENSVRRAAVQLRVAGRPEPLTLTCGCLREADNMADLVDGYCRLVNNSSSSLWTRKGEM